MINFAVGPVQMDSGTRVLGVEQVPYFRTPEFSSVMLQNEKLLNKFFDAPENSRVCFLTGSGTAAMEAAVLNFFTDEDKVLVVNGGSFGKRFAQLCKIYGVPHDEIALQAGENLTREKLEAYSGKNYTGLLIQLCETSTGVKYDLNFVGDFCKRNKLFLIVDAVSGFLADEFSMQKNGVAVALTGSQKALALPPGLSFLVLTPEAQKRCTEHKVRSLYFNLADYLKNGERGQTPFTPAVSVLLQLHEKLQCIENAGGVKSEREKIIARCTYFRREVQKLPLKFFIPEIYASNCVTVLQPIHPVINAYKIFEILKDEFHIWICPNGGELKEKIFRVGHIGNITRQDIDELLSALNELYKRGEL